MTETTTTDLRDRYAEADRTDMVKWIARTLPADLATPVDGCVQEVWYELVCAHRWSRNGSSEGQRQYRNGLVWAFWKLTGVDRDRLWDLLDEATNVLQAARAEVTV
jgi:hypothetical protein